MSFRLNFDLSFNFPPPPPRSRKSSPASDQASDGSTGEIKSGVRGWWQTAEQHPYFSLRLLYFLTSIAGIILGNLVLNDVWHYYSGADIHRTALALVIVGFLWQLLTIYDRRLFQGRQVPNWAIAVVETLGFLAFLALFISNRFMLVDVGDYLALGEMLLIAYNSAVWIVLCLVHGILAIKCYIQGARNVRSKRRGCPECGHTHAKGKGHAEGDEEALIGGGEEEGAGGEAGASEQTTSTPYRDEVEGDESH